MKKLFICGLIILFIIMCCLSYMLGSWWATYSVKAPVVSSEEIVLKEDMMIRTTKEFKILIEEREGSHWGNSGIFHRGYMYFHKRGVYNIRDDYGNLIQRHE